MSHADQLVSDFRLKNIPAFRRGDREYETSAAAANLSFAYTRPGCVVQPETTEQVQYIVEQAKDAGENIIVKGGGHSYTGFSFTDHGVLLDLKRMTAVKLQLSKEKKPATVKIQGGAKWVDVYRTLINGGWDGYVVIGGRCPAVGVGGFILGGGLGPFTREFGLGSDSLIEATIVTASGEKVVVNRGDPEKAKNDLEKSKNDPEKAKNDPAKSKDDPAKSKESELFWALCGAGSNAFGVVTEIRMKVQQLKHVKVVAGRYEWTIPEDKKKLTETMKQFYTAPWPNQMTIDSNWMLDVASPTSSTMKIRFSIYYNGGHSEFKQYIEKYIDDKELAAQLVRRCRPEQSTRFLHESLLLIWNEETRLFVPNQDDNAYQKYSSFCFTNDAKNIADILGAVEKLQEEFRKQLKDDKASFWITFIHSGGKAADFKPDESAYPWRETVYNTYVTIKFTDKWVETIANDFLLQAKNTLKKFSLNGNAAYINFSDSTIDKDWGEAYYGANFKRVEAIRKLWDPDSYFDWPWEKQQREIMKAKEVKRVDMNVITGWDLTDLAAWSSWTDKSTPVPVPPPSYEVAVAE